MKVGMRKFVVCMFAQLLFTFALIYGSLADSDYASCTMWNLAFFAGANGVEHFTKNKK